MWTAEPTTPAFRAGDGTAWEEKLFVTAARRRFSGVEKKQVDEIDHDCHFPFTPAVYSTRCKAECLVPGWGKWDQV
ncbi:hypothetical protein P8C59_000804 [Phyllachora maydis]|uniref:Uncharacterized protein n=1 Tax=Phyllachora maydis TaxID=1825666 RepID=A0AAD9M9C0_9PEZI|nr:hypothetical protein P8C59_000804 [Phyllachora maydis]